MVSVANLRFVNNYYTRPKSWCFSIWWLESVSTKLQLISLYHLFYYIRYLNENSWIYLLLFSLSCGPQILVMTLNSHSKKINHVYGWTLVHQSIPCILMWCLKWHSKDICNTTNISLLTGLFCPSIEVCNSNIPVRYHHSTEMLNFFGYFTIGYCMWWIPYFFWLLTFGIKHNIHTTGYGTMWSFTLENHQVINNIFCGNASVIDSNRRSSAYVFMLFHALACIWSFFTISFLCYHSFIVHSIVCMVSISYCIYDICKYYSNPSLTLQ